LNTVKDAVELREGRNSHAALGFAEEWQEEPGSSKASDSSIIGIPSLPELAEEALYGLPREVVKAVEPHTEADPVAVLVSLLASFGNALGQGTYFKVGPTFHYPKLFVALVGETSKARKGTSWDPVRELLYEVDPAWVEERVVSGLSSGEIKYPAREVLNPEQPAKYLGLGTAHAVCRTSLSLNEGAEGRVLIRCFDGCTTEGVVGAGNRNCGSNT
jgi:hypothetical protein